MTVRLVGRALALVLAVACTPPSGAAQTGGRPHAAARGAGVVTAPRAPAPGAPVPVAPDTIARDGQGNVTVRATRIVEPIVVDGRLDDDVYARVRAFGGFVQQEPHEGEPARAKTDVWLFFDDHHVYVAARCWQDASLRMVATDLRRDGPSTFDNDNFAVIFDTFRDRRNGFMFQTNPLGAINDQLMTDDGAGSNRDWNTVWDLRTSRDAEGWSVEMAIPFRSLRFAPGRDQVWGVNFRRNLQARTEYSYLARIPASAGRRGLARVSLAATLVGIEAPPVSRVLEVKPYALAAVTTDRDAVPVRANDADLRTGLDVKLGLGRSLTADFTAYTDFAQVEEDEAQVNLSRYSLFQPEKREFFLEGLGLFAFGGVPNARQGGSGGPPIAPVLFFSRRIGLADDDPVQILGGGRVTGRLGPWSVGALQVRQEESRAVGLPTTDFTVVRVKRDFSRRNSVGLIYTRRSAGETSPGLNTAGGVDLLLAPSQDLTVNAFLAASSTPGDGDDTSSYRVRVDYSADRYGLQLEHLVVGDDFNPDLGLMRREDFQRSVVEGRISRRPARGGWLRKWNLSAALDYGTDNDRVLESRSQTGRLGLELTNGDQATLAVERSYEALPEELELTDDLRVPVGRYGFTTVKAGYELGLKHLFSGDVTVGAGTFYGGTIREVSYKGRVDVARLTLEPNVSLNRLDLPWRPGADWVNVLGLRGTWPFSPRATLGVLVQYSTDGNALGASARLRWEYRPGSDLFVVYSEGRDTLRPASPMVNRGVAVKVTRLVRF